MGGFGLIALGVLDSSFLFMPLGNDLLVVALTARKPQLMMYYAAMAAAGSVLGTLIVDATSRKLGEKGLEDRVPKKRLEYIQRRFDKHAAVSLFLASLMPPPFPFTVFVIVAAAMQYSRTKLLAAVGVGRLVRFSALGLLAMLYGRQVIKMAEHPVVRWAIIALAIISIAGSALSIWKWLKRSRNRGAVREAEEQTQS